MDRLVRLLAIVIAAGLAVGSAGAQGGVPASSAPAVAPLGAISGIVLDATDVPIADVIVSLSGRSAEGQQVSLQQLTDVQGRFVFRELPAARYRIYVRKPGYDERMFPSGAKSSNIYVSLAAGQSVSDSRAWLWQLGSIGGRVVDERGEPVVGTPVRAFAQVMVGGRARFVASHAGVTDDRGDYRVANLPPGGYFVMWSPGRVADGAARTYPATYYPASRERAGAVRVALGAGEDHAGADIRLEPMAVGRVEGRLDGSLEGLVGARLRLLHAGDIDLGFDYETATAVVNNDGTFAFPSVPVGQYLIEALPSQTEVTFGALGSALEARRTAAEVPLPAMYGPDPVRPGGGFVLPSETGAVSLGYYRRLVGGWVRATVEVVAGRAERVVVAVRPTVSLSGRVMLEEKPPLQAGAERPALLAGMRAEPVDLSFGLAVANFAGTPDPLGSFRIGGLLPGDYYLTSGGLHSVKSILWNGRDYADRSFDASTGEDFSDVVVTLTSKRSTLSGTIRDARGTAVPSATVIGFPTDRALWTAFGLMPRRLGSVTANERGSFTTDVLQAMTPLPAGDYFLIAVRSVPTDWMNTAYLDAAASLATRVSVGWGETKTVDLELKEVVVR